MLRSLTATALLSAALLAGSVPAVAQSSDSSELTAAEIRERLLSQRTRGLVIAPSAKPAPAPAAAPVVTTAAAPTTLIEMPDDVRVDIRINFDFDSAALRADQSPKVDTMCEVMQSLDIGRYRIVGHTDASGSAGYNENLSRLRAEEVKRYLVNTCGINGERLEAVGAGEQLLLDESDPNGDANRRVEFQVIS